MDREHPPSCTLQSQGLCQAGSCCTGQGQWLFPSHWPRLILAKPQLLWPIPFAHPTFPMLDAARWGVVPGNGDPYLPSHSREVQDRRKSGLQSMINPWKAEMTDSCQSINDIKWERQFGCIWPPMGAQAKHLPARLLIKNGVFIKLRFGRRVRGGVTFPTKLSSSAGTAIIFITFWQPTRFTTAFH